MSKLCLLLLALVLCSATVRAGQDAPDYYTLAVTLTPAFCALNPDKAATRQCRSNMPLSVHGLWPESRSGSSPAYCRSGAFSLSSATSRALDTVMPDEGLRRYQWQKHGACSGLPPERFFGMLLSEFRELKWPATVTAVQGRDRVVERSVVMRELRAANPGLKDDAVYLRCQGRGRPPYLVEMRICLSPGGEFASCGRTLSPNCPTAVKIRAR